MSFLARAALFVVKQVASPALEEFGKHVGIATGRVVAKKIDPSFPSEEGEEADSEEGDGDETSEDEKPVIGRLWCSVRRKLGHCPCGCTEDIFR